MHHCAGVPRHVRVPSRYEPAPGTKDPEGSTPDELQQYWSILQAQGERKLTVEASATISRPSAAAAGGASRNGSGDLSRLNLAKAQHFCLNAACGNPLREESHAYFTACRCGVRNSCFAGNRRSTT
jgi:hypothetical protein